MSTMQPALNIAQAMVQTLSQTDTGRIALSIIAKLQLNGHRALVCGGSVRDLLLATVPKDVDLVTDAVPARLTELFPRTIPVGVAFGVVQVVEQGIGFEVATFRSDGAYADGRRPSSVRFGSLEEDVKRRDFTCNGLYLEVTPARLIDLVGGRADLAARLLRAIGDPEARLAEDHLRLLRAARFACQLACELDASLLAAMTRCAPLLRQVSSERVGSELGRMLCGRDPGRGIRLLWATGALAALWPGCQFERDAWERAARMLDRLVHGELESALVCLLLAEPPAHHAAMLERLRLSRDQQRRIQALLAGIATLEAGPSLVARKRLLREPFAPALLEVCRARALASDGRLDLVIEWQCELHGWLREACLWPQPLLDGRALVALGFPAGPRLGALLRELEDAQLSGAITTLEQAHAWLARMRP